MRRVAITAIAPVTPLGSGPGFFDHLLEGKSGIAVQQKLVDGQAPVHMAGCVTTPLDGVTSLQRATTDRYSQLLLQAAHQLFESDPMLIDFAANTGVFVGSGAGGLETFVQQVQVMQSRGPGRVSPLALPKTLANMGAAHIAMHYGLQGPLVCTSTACAAGLDAICQAHQSIVLGECDVAVAGGTEAPVHTFAISAFHALGALAPNHENPSEASKPFDAHRSGFVMSEGAGLVVLEEWEHAKQRGAKIHGEVLGFGRTNDHHHYVNMRPDGAMLAKAMELALRNARIGPESIDWISAHGTGTVVNDRTETLAIKKAFNGAAQRISISSIKSMVGHTLGASGPIALIAALYGLDRQSVPPTINLLHPDPELDLDYTPHVYNKRMLQHVMVNSFAFGGHNTCLVVARGHG